MNCDVGEVTEGLEKSCDVVKPTEGSLIQQAFRHFTYVTTHSPTLPSLSYFTVHSSTLPLLHLRHSSFSNPSFASPTPQALHLIHLASRPCYIHVCWVHVYIQIKSYWYWSSLVHWSWLNVWVIIWSWSTVIKAKLHKEVLLQYYSWWKGIDILEYRSRFLTRISKPKCSSLCEWPLTVHPSVQ